MWDGPPRPGAAGDPTGPAPAQPSSVLLQLDRRGSGSGLGRKAQGRAARPAEAGAAVHSFPKRPTLIPEALPHACAANLFPHRSRNNQIFILRGLLKLTPQDLPAGPSRQLAGWPAQASGVCPEPACVREDSGFLHHRGRCWGVWGDKERRLVSRPGPVSSPLAHKCSCQPTCA